MSTLTPTPAPKLTVHRPAQAGITILAVAAIVALLYFGRVFFITIVVAITIAFLLDPLLTPFLKLRMPRSVASFIVCSVSLLVLYLIGLGLYTQFSGFVQELPTFSQRMNELWTT
jgi:predicted PurR-regulated permease PerM